jgi:glycosyltransferase involved in cell wall biosynthesis
MDDSFGLHLPAPAAKSQFAGAGVLVVTPVGLQGRGGIDRLNLYLHTYLEQRGAGGYFRFIGSRGEWPGPFWLLTFLNALFQFGICCMSGKYGLAHIHVSTNGSALRKVAFGFLARLFRMPYVIQYHGMISEDFETTRPLWFRALGSLARGANRTILLGEPYRAPFEQLGVAPANILIIHNGISDIGRDADIPRSNSDVVRVLFSGEVGERKGAPQLVEALAILAKRNLEWSCTIAGNGDVDSNRTAAAVAGLSDRVTFTGWIDIARVHELMREADIVVLPSRAEASPLGLIEGASAGAALVATDVGAVRDVVVDGVNGIIVRRDAADIAAALEKLIVDRGLRESMQIASRQIYRERFQLSHFVTTILGCHDAVRRR